MRLLRQPAESNRLGDYLNHQLAQPWTHFRAAVAFVKRSGTRHVRDSLKIFGQGGEIQMTVGIDHQGSSVEGLSDLLDAVPSSGRVIAFHNLLPLTFHPKVYLFKSPEAADLVIGSGNLTGGGLYSNYEAGIRLSLDLARPNDSAFLATVDLMLDGWADTSTGLAHQLDAPLLAALKSAGLVAQESSDQAAADEDRRRASRGGGPHLPFVARSEPGAPSSHKRPQVRSSEPVSPAQPRLPASGRPQPHRFLMTLQQTDVGVGQTTTGTSRRSPEIFVPLAARDANPEFWNWPDAFESDASGKRDRRGVRVRLGAETILVNMMYWPQKRDFRLRSEKLRSAGQVGDILRMEKVGPPADYDYYVEVVPRDTSQHEFYLDLCRHPVQNSLRRYGYY